MNKKTGYYFVGFVTQASLDSMPSQEMRDKWPLDSPMSNTTPLSRADATKRAKAHHLRDVTLIRA